MREYFKVIKNPFEVYYSELAEITCELVSIGEYITFHPHLEVDDLRSVVPAVLPAGHIGKSIGKPGIIFSYDMNWTPFIYMDEWVNGYWNGKPERKGLYYNPSA